MGTNCAPLVADLLPKAGLVVGPLRPCVRPSICLSVRPSATLFGCLVCVICNSKSFHSFLFKLCIMIVHIFKMCTFNFCADFTKTLLQSEPIFYGNLVYKFKRIVGKPNFSDQFRKIVKRYIKVGYYLDVMRQSACLVLNPITVYSYGFLFNCTTVGQASESMTTLT